ncbi:hypothetical protein [Rhizosphaericola mali]|uniref:Uncharacterized protein n=1 Tax=Rhizosphaericola mali TaxID=2545455 RepID=A0A5P2G9S8_9BACT|nr:hypothetical protein [Rhizosphaericola mali]QES88281.1 hypothetical protein E0W69_006230 [Rhizosphaericola mali]
MGLDIYAGTFTRYYSGNWKTVIQQWSDRTGTPVEVVRQNQPKDVLTNVSEIQEISEVWRDHLANALKAHSETSIFWIESNDLPYHTDKPDWDCFGAVILWALYNEQKNVIPNDFDKEWTSSEIFKKSLLEDYKTIYPSLTQDCEIWLPIDIQFTFRYSDPTEKEVGIASSLRLLEDLDKLNNATWKADNNIINEWRKEIDPNTNSFDEKAKFGFSILYDLAKFSVDNKTPMKLDY